MAETVAKRAKRPSKPLYFDVRRLVDPATGEEVGALVPHTKWDKAAMRARKYHVGSLVRAELKKPRNPVFHAMAHALGTLMLDQADGFEGLDAHGAVKRLQRESGICCEELEIDLGEHGKVPVMQPRSISFDEMDEGDFSQLVHGLCAHIRKHYLGVPNEALEEIIFEIENGRT